jgi:hypothetical protein
MSVRQAEGDVLDVRRGGRDGCGAGSGERGAGSGERGAGSGERGAAEAIGARAASGNPAVAVTKNALRKSAVKRLCLVMRFTFARRGSTPVALLWRGPWPGRPPPPWPAGTMPRAPPDHHSTASAMTATAPATTYRSRRLVRPDPRLSRDRTRCPRCPASRCTTRCRHRQAVVARVPRRARPAVRIRPQGRPGALHPRARCPPARQDASGS